MPQLLKYWNECHDTLMGLLCFNLFGKVNKGLAYQKERKSVTVAKDHGQCFIVLLALAASSLTINVDSTW